MTHNNKPKDKKSVCGSWWCKKIVPDNPFGIDFRKACEKHDTNYIEKNKTRLECDKIFLHDLLTACDQHSANRFWRSLAYTYYAAVRIFGWTSYYF